MSSNQHTSHDEHAPGQGDVPIDPNDSIEAMVPTIHYMVPIMGAILMFLLAFIAVFVG